MSLFHALRHEVKPASATAVPHRLVNSNPTAPAEQVLRVQIAADDSLTPREGQPVFEQTLPSRTTQSRRVVITALLVLANLVQVRDIVLFQQNIYMYDVY
jgi:hypothetical protein